MNFKYSYTSYNIIALMLLIHKLFIIIIRIESEAYYIIQYIINIALDLLDKNDFMLYSGDDPTATQFMLNGGSGTISVTANVVPSIIAEICTQALSGESKKAIELNLEIEQLNEILFVESNPIPVKWILNRLGRIPGGLRLPLVELDDKFHNQAELILKELSLLN